MAYPVIDPVIFYIFGPLALRWYSLSYMLGVFVSWKALQHRNNQDNFCKKSQIDDIVSYGILGLVVGARVAYAFFYNFNYFIIYNLEILKIWEGGLSFHGGLIGLVLAVSIYCKKYQIPLYKITDTIAPYIPLSLFFGRIANFINGELYGRVTSSFVGMVFPTDPEQLIRHPSQLYEAIGEGLILFCVLFFLFKKKRFDKKPYLLTALAIIFYSIIRFFLEFFRQPDIQIGYIWSFLTMGQLLSVVLIILGILMLKYKVNGIDN